MRLARRYPRFTSLESLAPMAQFDFVTWNPPAVRAAIAQAIDALKDALA